MVRGPRPVTLGGIQKNHIQINTETEYVAVEITPQVAVNRVPESASLVVFTSITVAYSPNPNATPNEYLCQRSPISGTRLASPANMNTCTNRTAISPIRTPNILISA